ncbi:MAG: TetR/AcrR family transcriptional regulator [Crocinitomicaceae bacterium]
MTPQERKKGKKEDVRKLILDAAKKLFIEQGYEATSMRNIATEINYSPTTIYLYYKDKGDIIYALHQEGFTILKMLFMPLATVEAPFERLKALGRTYLNFAKEYPEYYEVMFMMKETMDHLDKTANEELWKEEKKCLDLLFQPLLNAKKKVFLKKTIRITLPCKRGQWCMDYVRCI